MNIAEFFGTWDTARKECNHWLPGKAVRDVRHVASVTCANTELALCTFKECIL